ncbi:MAG: acetyltransferase [Saprospiraceae bacterium]|nr:MAG: acetyltransferase [Saprospiraceae bacterium]
MAAIIYYITLPLIYAISLLPFWLLYLLSDFTYLVLYKLIGYRTKVVHTNLKNAFPEKSDREIQQIQDRFYRYFCDLIFETLKTLSITPSVLKKRVKFKDVAVFEKFYQQKQSIIVVMGHLGNWELGGARFSQDPYHQLFVIYHPLRNKYFDGLVYHMRTRLGNKLYTMKNTFRGMISNRNEVTATAFIADQTPSPKGAFWTQFLNQDTPIFGGTAKIAKKLNYPIVYVSIKRPKRGYYEVDSELLIETPGAYTEDEISETHTRRLDRDIQENPDIWLWTHRRWKHKRIKE